MSAQFNDQGKVALWANESGNPAAPTFKGTLFAHRDLKAGEEISVSLWARQPDANPRAPALKGKLSDKFVPTEAAPRSVAPIPQVMDYEEPNDEIPF